MKKKVAIFFTDLSMLLSVVFFPQLIILGFILLQDKSATSSTSIILDLARLIRDLYGNASDPIESYVQQAIMISDNTAIWMIVTGFLALFISMAISIVTRVFLAKYQSKKYFILLAWLSIFLTNISGLIGGIILLTMKDDDFLKLNYHDVIENI